MSEQVHEHGPYHPHTTPPSDVELRVRALESLLTDKGFVDPAALDALIDTYATKVGPRNGAKVVARAWVDPAFKQRLLEDATGAIAEMGFVGRQGEDMVVLENSPTVHHLVVCTLCSCYPWPLLTGPVRFSTRAACSESSAWRLPRTSRCASGTARPSSATWSCRSARPAPRG